MITTSPTYNPFPTVRSPGAAVSFEVIAKALNKNDITPSASETAKAGSPAETIDGIAAENNASVIWDEPLREERRG